MDQSFSGGSEDIDFSWRVTESGRELVWEPEAILYYRQRHNEKAVFMQVYRYARENVLLWNRLKKRGIDIHSVSFKTAILRSFAVPFLFIRNHDWNSMGGYGGRLGALDGNIRYRILKQKSSPILHNNKK